MPRILSFLLVQKRHHRSQLRSRQVQRSQFLPHQGKLRYRHQNVPNCSRTLSLPQVQIKRLFWHPPKLSRLLRPLRQWWYRTCKACQMDLSMRKMISGRAHQVVSVEATPAAQSNVSSVPLFDESQIRRFQEIYNQAPWLYPGNQLLGPPAMVPQPIARPCFWSKMSVESMELGWLGIKLHTCFHTCLNLVPLNMLNLEGNWKRIMEENQKLRARIETLDSMRVDDDQKFSTPEEPKKEAVDPHSKEAAGSRAKEAVDPHSKEVAGSPLKGGCRPPLKGGCRLTLKGGCRPPLKGGCRLTLKGGCRPPL